MESLQTAPVASLSPPAPPLWSFLLVRRLAFLAALFSLELVIVTLFLDTERLSGLSGIAGAAGDWGSFILRVCVVAPIVFATFACLRFQAPLAAISERLAASPISPRALAAHAVCMASFGGLARLLYGGAAPVNPDLLTVLWLLAGVLGIGFAAAAFIPASVWREIAQGTGYLWMLALAAALAAAVGGDATRHLWRPAAQLTFTLVKWLLRPLGGYSSDPVALSIGSERFSVYIAPSCSGLEGIGLVLAFTTVWLILFHRECRFPRALILLPLGAVAVFLANSVRIAALIVLGDAGFPGIALGGFHSQAGWIGFNLVALGISLAARESRWLSVKAPRAESKPARTANPTAPWVLPFVAILAAGMMAHALSAGFEWLYPLRFAAAAAALFALRRNYAGLDKSVDWTAPAAGALVFGMWIALDRSAPGPMPPALAAAPAAAAFCWIAIRALAATVTVPIAEELAFRGFVMRRFIAADFETVSFARFSWFAIVASSVIFGALHGSRWIAGALAGAIYALVTVRRGRLANAVVAHAVTNALIAADVLLFHRWELW